jgi:hypothetical protein
MDIPMIENYNPKAIVLGKVDDKSVKFYTPGQGDDMDNIRFQIPKMRIAFDPDGRKSAMGKLFVKNISLSTNEIGSDNNKQRIEILRTKLEKTEKYIKRILPTHLSGKTFSHSLWQGKNKDFKPIFKVSISYNRDEKSKAGIFDSDNKPVGDECLEKGKIVSMALRLDKLWIWNDKIGINWEVEQVKIYDQEPVKAKKQLLIRKDE